MANQALRFRVLVRDGFRCRYCGARPSPDRCLHIDHVVARSRGGGDNIENLAAACGDCNLGKGASQLPSTFVLTESEFRAVRNHVTLEYWHCGVISTAVDDESMDALIRLFDGFPYDAGTHLFPLIREIAADGPGVLADQVMWLRTLIGDHHGVI